MGIDVQLRNESGDVLQEVADPRMVLSKAAREGFPGTTLLRYVCPWNDAMFNQAQALDLAADIRSVTLAQPNTELSRQLSGIEPLVERLSREAHVYLWFVGD